MKKLANHHGLRGISARLHLHFSLWQNHCYDCGQLSASPTTFFSTSSKSPSKPSAPWERSAKLVKNTDVTNKYLDHIRAETVDPALQLKTIEDELCGAIGKALGRQGEKILFAMREMTEEHIQYNKHIEGESFQQALKSAQRHNEARKRAIKARWELLVHRQCAGLIVDNHRVVHETFPISGKLPDTVEEMERTLEGVSVDMADESKGASDRKDVQQKNQFGDQLDWWQRIGRWR